MKSNTDLWANFLYNERLDPDVLWPEDVMTLVKLCQEMGEIRGPKIGCYQDKLNSRRFVCEMAIAQGVDLPAIRKKKGKVAMGRGLLDMWNRVYAEIFGGIEGTVAAREAKRRDIKTRLCKAGIKGVRTSLDAIDKHGPVEWKTT